MPIHSIWRCLNTLYTSNMDVGCSKWWFTASTMTPQHIWALPYPNFSKFGPNLHRYKCKGAPICPSTAYYGTQTLYIYADICYMTNPPLRYILFLSARASTGSVTSELSQSLVQSLMQKNADFGGVVGKEGVIFFNETLQGPYWHTFKWNGVLRIGPEAIWKNDIFSCGPPRFGRSSLTLATGI